MKKHIRMFNEFFSEQSKRIQYLTAALVVLVVAGIGTYLLLSSHASSPYASINADSGTLTSPATKQTCTGSTDGSCVVFGGSGSGTTVSATPYGPAAPSGGWQVEYADGFGDCLINTSTGCTTGAARSDNSLVPSSGQPSNSNEPTWYVPSQLSVNSNGLDLNCNYSPGIASGKNYACGELSGVHSPDPSGYKIFHFQPGQGETWAFQVVAKAPPTTGEEDPAYWAFSNTWQWEIDFPEMWGYSSGSGGKNWCQGGDAMGFPAIPRSNGGSSAAGEGDVVFCSNSTVNFDPSQAYHTYTVLMSGTTFSSYVDGKRVTYDWNRAGQTSFSVGTPGSWSTEPGGLVLQHSLRDGTTGNPDPYFESGTRTFSVRSIAVYENASANNSHTTNAPLIAPGTNIK